MVNCTTPDGLYIMGYVEETAEAATVVVANMLHTAESATAVVVNILHTAESATPQAY